MHASVAIGRSHRHPGSTRTAQTIAARHLGIQTLGRLAVAALIIATICVSAQSLATQPRTPSPYAWATVSVASYETLWDLARTHGVEGLTTAATIELIRAENGLPSSTLYEGQIVRVPASAVSETTVAQR